MQLALFDWLLDLEDMQMWDLVSGWREPAYPDLVVVLELLRGCWRGEQEHRT